MKEVGMELKSRDLGDGLTSRGLFLQHLFSLDRSGCQLDKQPPFIPLFHYCPSLLAASP